jgi:hypothetical protein
MSRGLFRLVGVRSVCWVVRDYESRTTQQTLHFVGIIIVLLSTCTERQQLKLLVMLSTVINTEYRDSMVICISLSDLKSSVFVFLP